jgi:hypothetical protein
MLYLDYTAPVEQIREKAKELAEQSPLWNRRVFNVQVSDATEETMEVRILVSANSASATWDLRCDIREKLVDFLAREHPGALPRRRQQGYQDEPAINAKPHREARSPPLSTARAKRG